MIRDSLGSALAWNANATGGDRASHNGVCDKSVLEASSQLGNDWLTVRESRQREGVVERLVERLARS